MQGGPCFSSAPEVLPGSGIFVGAPGGERTRLYKGTNYKLGAQGYVNKKRKMKSVVTLHCVRFEPLQDTIPAKAI